MKNVSPPFKVLSCFRFCICLLFLSACQSTPDPVPHNFHVVCDARLASVLNPVLPEIENNGGAFKVTYLPAEDIPNFLLEEPVDAVLSLENLSEVSYLLKRHRGAEEPGLTERYEKFFPPPQKGKSVVVYEVFRPQKHRSRFQEWVRALEESEFRTELNEWGFRMYSSDLVPDYDVDGLMAIIFPSFKFRRIPFEQAVDELWTFAEAEKPGMEFPERRISIDGAVPPITLELRNVLFSDALLTLTEISGLYFRIEKEEIIFYTSGKPGPAVKFCRVKEDNVYRFLDRLEEGLGAESQKSINDRLNAVLPAFLRTNYSGYTSHVEYERLIGRLLIFTPDTHTDLYDIFLRAIQFPSVPLKDLQW